MSEKTSPATASGTASGENGALLRRALRAVEELDQTRQKLAAAEARARQPNRWRSS